MTTAAATQPRRRVSGLLATLIVILGALSAVLVFANLSRAALGGPVIIGGDDLTDHGSYDSTADENFDGWLYLQKALENIEPNVTITNDGSVAALGSAPSTATSADAGAAIGHAADKAGLTVTYHEGAPAIEQFFADLRGGTATPAIIWIAGDGASNDLDSTEAGALTNNATSMGDFVNGGGGLMSHGSEYGWLFGLLPNAGSVDSGSSGDLVLTTAGSAAFPGLTNADVNAGPWHNHFEGDLGGLEVLVSSNSINDSTGNDASVIIGGASVTLPGSINLEPPTATNPIGASHTVTATVRDNQGAVLPGQLVTFSVTAGPNAGDGGQGTTDSNGQTSFTYVGDGGAGTDTIQASFVDSTGTTRTATATATWGPECSDGIDNDNDGFTDFAADGSGDPDCDSADDTSEGDTPPPTGECNDGLDNDGDGATDIFDRDCNKPDDDESGSDEPECSDGIDNDGDGKRDFIPGDTTNIRSDPDCTDDDDDSEAGTPPPPPQCSDGIDNDGDTLIDFAEDGSGDPGCDSAADDDETDTPPPPPQCADGVDNDGDTLIDFAEDGTGDPGCESATDDDETDVATTCSADEDGDGVPHSSMDPAADETGPVSGIVHEVDLALPPPLGADGGVVTEVNCALVAGALGL